MRARRLRLLGSRPEHRGRPSLELRGGAAPARVDRPPEPVREDPCDDSGRRRDRGHGRRRQEHQRDLDLLRSALPRGRRGLHPRSRAAGRGRGDPATIHSVASFFVSRVDTETDKRLDEIGGHGELKGKLGIANAQVADQHYLEAFAGRRWERLASEGATTQRCLWASTSTGYPAYADVMYVEGLIGPQTVNTMPEETIRAFQDHGRVAETLTQGWTKHDVSLMSWKRPESTTAMSSRRSNRKASTSSQPRSPTFSKVSVTRRTPWSRGLAEPLLG